MTSPVLATEPGASDAERSETQAPVVVGAEISPRRSPQPATWAREEPGEQGLSKWGDTRTLIDELLAEQQRLTAVERFTYRHQPGALSAQTGFYRDLLPATAPGEGEQYAFAVDLDACSGCKACVTACHNLNGLEENETWRSVGLLHGGAALAPTQYTVTTACHHCIEPACLQGCPVLAYEKDPATGIVRHLDDQCIGCQYCILKCPYDVPKYSSRRGIVRKCDMCSNRLAVGEAPACAQACPNGAISITLVNQAELAAEAQRGHFLPGAPDPAYTNPTTRYRSRRKLPANLAPADQHLLKPGHSHPPLVAMLVLTQLSVGAFSADTVLRALFPENLMTRLSPWHALVGLALGLLALGASTLHLGRPQYAWRSVIGLKTSWLSREILAFSLFAGLATLEAASFWFRALGPLRANIVSATVSASGLFGVYCSFMIYHDTRREFWRGAEAALKFLGTTVVLGTATVLFLATLQALVSPSLAGNGAYRELTRALTVALTVSCLAKLGLETAMFRHLREGSSSSLKRTALLLRGELAEITTARFVVGAIGGIVLPLTFLARQPAPGIATLGVTVWILAFGLFGELLERYLFFVASASERMPGGIGT